MMEAGHRSVWHSLHRGRTYVLSRMLQWRIVPRGLVFSQTLGLLSIADLLLAAPLMALAILIFVNSFVQPSVTESGNTAHLSIVYTFILANKKNSLWSLFFGISWKRLVPFHFAAAIVSGLSGLFHGWVVLQATNGSFSQQSHERMLWKFLWSSSANSTGTIAFLCLTISIIISFYRAILRKLCFDFWLLLHVTLAASVLVLLAMHGSTTLIVMLAAWWSMDWILRYTLIGRTTLQRKLMLARLTLATKDVAEIRFPREFSFTAGQFVRIAVPSIGGLQFHPASISSAPYESDVTMHMKARGGWTRSLLSLAKEGCEVEVILEGPYGNLSVDLCDHSHILLVCGGIGVTPLISIARQLLHENQMSKMSVQLVWVVRDRDLDLVTALPVVAPSIAFEQLETTSSSDASVEEIRSVAIDVGIRLQTPSTHLSIDVYVTGQRFKSCAMNHVPCRVHEARPDVDSIIGKHPSSRMAVIVCGPEGMVRETAVSCRKHAHNGRTIDFHSEVFNY